MQNRIKKIVFSILMFMVIIIPVRAKKVNVEKLGAEIEKIFANANSAYIIGEYVFTNNIGLSDAGLMLGATTIPDACGAEYSEALKNSMTINYISRTMDENGRYGSWTIKSQPILGTSKITADETFEIKYIDYKFIAEDSEIENLLGNIDEYNDKLSQSGFKNSEYSQNLSFNKINGNKYELKGLLLKKENVAGLNDHQTGYYVAFALNIPQLNNESTLTISDGDYTKEFSQSDYKIDSNKGTAIIWPINSKSVTKTITITLDIDGAKNKYGSTTYELVWDEELKFQEDSKASMNMNFTAEETREVKEKLNYEKTKEDTYSLTFDNDKTYTLSNDVVKQNGPDKHFAGTDPKGYYALFKLTIENVKPGETTIELPCKSCTKTGNKKTIIVNDQEFLFLMALDKNGEPKTFNVTVDLDGSKQEYLPVTYTVKYDSVNFKEATEVKMSINKEGVKEEYQYNADPSIITLVNNTLTGTVPLSKGVTKTSLTDGTLTNYYVPIKLEITGKTEATKIYVNSHESKDETLLLPVSESKKETETFNIKVDNGSGYVPFEVTISYKNLLFQKESNAEFNTKINGVSFENWDISKQDSGLIFDKSADTFTLKGKVKEQKTIDGEKKPYFAFSVSASSAAGLNPTVTIGTGDDIGQLIQTKETSTSSIPKKIFNYLYELPTDLAAEKEIKVTVDLDGEKNAYAARTYTIKLNASDINVIHLYTLSFEGVEGYPTQDLYADEIPNIQNPDSSEYRKFTHWIDKNSNSEVQLTQALTGDVTVKPYYEIYLNNYIAKYTNDFSSENMELTHSGENYTFKVTKPRLTLNNLNDTKLTDTFKAMLSDLKLASIKINSESVNSIDNVESTLIKNLSSHTTYDDVINAGNVSISLKVENGTDYKIHDGDIKEYTFNFKSDFRVVKTKDALTKALSDSNVNEIYLDGDITDLDQPLEINHNVLIDGKKTDGNYVLKSTSSDNVMKVSSGNVTINNLKIDGGNNASEAILVEDGNLNVDTLEVTNIKTYVSDAYAAIKADAGTVTVSNLTFAGESYDIPAIRAKEAAIVTLNRDKKTTASKKSYQEVSTYESRKDSDPSAALYGDKLQDKAAYDYKHYYLNSEKEAKWYKITFQGDIGVTRILTNWTRYIVKGETFNEKTLPNDIAKLTTYTTGVYNYTVKEICLRHTGSTTCNPNIQSFNAPDGDTTYYISLTGSLSETAREVSTAEALHAALEDATVKDILVKGDIDLTDPSVGEYFPNGELVLKHEGVDLEGQYDARTKYQNSITGKIKVTADNVTIERVHIKGKNSQEEKANGIITTSNKGLYLYQVKIEDLSGDFKNAVYYDVAAPEASVYFSEFKSTNLTSFIEFKRSVGGERADFKTTFIGNDFIGSESTKEFIVFDSLNNSTQKIDLTFRQSGFKFANANDYAIMIKSAPTGTQPINFYFNIPTVKAESQENQVRIGIVVTDAQYDASSITFHRRDSFKNLAIRYIKDTAETENNPQGVAYNAKIGNDVE